MSQRLTPLMILCPHCGDYSRYTVGLDPNRCDTEGHYVDCNICRKGFEFDVKFVPVAHEVRRGDYV